MLQLTDNEITDKIVEKVDFSNFEKADFSKFEKSTNDEDIQATYDKGSSRRWKNSKGRRRRDVTSSDDETVGLASALSDESDAASDFDFNPIDSPPVSHQRFEYTRVLLLRYL